MPWSEHRLPSHREQAGHEDVEGGAVKPAATHRALSTTVTVEGVVALP